jgi:hypothetical protein
MEMLREPVLQAFALSAKAEETAKSVSEWKGKEILRAISTKDVEWQVRFEELAEQVAKFSKAGHLDAESIAEVKTRIASCPLTALPVRKKVAEAAPPAPPPITPTVGRRVRDPSPSPLPENNDEEGRHSPLPRCRRHYAPEYSQYHGPELEVTETRRDVHLSDSQIVFVKKENKQPIDKPKLVFGKSTDNFRVWHKSVKTYFGYERKSFNVDVNKIDWFGGWLEGKALVWHQYRQECFELSHRRES